MRSFIIKIKDSILISFNLLRVKQYVKNLLIFAPCFFGVKLIGFDVFQSLFVAFIGFCFITSFIYILNDIKDREFDKFHPSKKDRPIASDKISIKSAFLIAAFCLIIGLFLLKNAIWVVLSYLLLNFLYIFLLKKIAIIDIICVAFGYVLRLFVGSVVYPQVELSHWIIIMTFLLALFLVASKRYDDVQYSDENIRECIKDYSKEFLTCLMSVLVAIIIIAYILYTLSSNVIEFFNCDYLYITSIFVLVGILRYLQLTIVYNSSTSPTNIVYNDNIIKVSIVLWILSFLWILYL